MKYGFKDSPTYRKFSFLSRPIVIPKRGVISLPQSL